MRKTRTWVCSRCGAHRSKPIAWTTITCPNKTMPCFGQPMELGDTVGKWTRASTARRALAESLQRTAEFNALAARRQAEADMAKTRTVTWFPVASPRPARVTPQQQDAGRIWKLEALVSTLADYLEEAHQTDMDNNHANDDLEESPCSYCLAIAEARSLLREEA